MTQITATLSEESMDSLLLAYVASTYGSTNTVLSILKELLDERVDSLGVFTTEYVEDMMKRHNLTREEPLLEFLCKNEHKPDFDKPTQIQVGY